MLCLDDATLLGFLKEDTPFGDLTTRSLEIGNQNAKMTFQARNNMCVCAVEEAERLLNLIGCDVETFVKSGSLLEKGSMVLKASGSAEKIFIAWKVAQTMIEWTSGVATCASKLVQITQELNPNCIIACTRKAIPGTRALSARAVLSAGASLHRNGLSDTVLLFPEHREFGSSADILKEQIKQLKRHCPERSIVVEVKNKGEALIALESEANVIQLEKFTPSEIENFMVSVGPDKTTRVAAAGGINPNNVHEYAQTGADILVTSSPYYAKPADIQVIITPDGPFSHK